jgi:Ulp1 family protease
LSAVSVLLLLCDSSEFNIFEMDKLILPINFDYMHWVCMIVFMKTKQICVLDSMGGDYETYVVAMKKYLKDEYETRYGSKMPSRQEWQKNSRVLGSVPQQRNGECGLEECLCVCCVWFCLVSL